MAFPNDDNDTFIQALLQERDHLYRETVKLREELKSYSDVITLKQTITAQEGTINKQAEKISSLEQQIQGLLRKIWGKSSERYIAPDPLQRRIDFDGLDLLPEEAEAARQAEKEVVEYKQVRVTVKEKKQPVREPLPENLPRLEEHIYPDIDPDCGKWAELSPEITEILEHEPASFYVRRIIRHKYVLKDKALETDTPIVTAALPALPLARSYASSSLLAEIMVNKYVNHLPFYRQIQMFKQLGVTIPASTLNDWFRETADLLRPLYYRLREEVLSSDYIQVDETTLPVVNDEKHKAVKGYLWMVRSVMEKTVFFHYDQGSRAQKVVVELLKDFRGALQTDGYEVYSIYENKKGVLPLGCWAHARRKFEEALKEDELRAGYALQQIGLLYDVERRADEENLSYEDRAELRSRLSYPIMCALEKWIVKEYPHVLPKGRIGKALGYTYKIYHRLSRYHLDGRYRIDNNLAENAIRPVALGRKNYLFCGNHSAAEDAAVIYSLFGCCKEVDVNFREWLVYVLDNIHSYDNDYTKDLAELLPKQWKTKNNNQSTVD
jgi:transposase